jgi:hypothetical protein
MQRGRRAGDGAPTVGSVFQRDRPQAQRALVSLVPAAPADPAMARPVRVSPNAAFLTHLIATAQGAFQTRKLRRADPYQVIATYAAMVLVPQSPSRPSREYRR